MVTDEEGTPEKPWLWYKDKAREMGLRSGKVRKENRAKRKAEKTGAAK